MNVVSLRPQNENRAVPGVDLDVARVVVFDDMAAAEPYWRSLEAADTLATPYQNFDFLRHWQAHVGAPAGVTPFIVVGFNAADTPLYLWPLGVHRSAGLTVAEYLGGKHANFNMGLWRRELGARMTLSDMKTSLNAIKGKVDWLRLLNQPLTWDGTTNPFALFARQSSSSEGYSGRLIPDFEALLRARTNATQRKKMRKKEKALAELGVVRFERAQDPQTVRLVLDTFFKQKHARMRAIGVHDTFAEPGVRRFIEATVTEPAARGEPAVELYALFVDDIVVATMGGIVGDGRFCAMFNSIGQGRLSAESPGEQLIVHLVRQCCQRGLTIFDLGIGGSRYKKLFCEDAEPMFDNFIALSVPGILLAHAHRWAGRAKRAIKQNETLWALVTAARRLQARFL